MYQVAFFLLFSAFFIASDEPRYSIYLTEKEFLENKPSKTADRLVRFTSFGKVTLRFKNGEEKIPFTAKTAWGYRRYYNDYRFIDGQIYFIAARGAIWLYSGNSDGIYMANDTVMYRKFDNKYPLASKGFKGETVKIHNLKDLSKLTTGLTVDDMKKLIKDGTTTSMLEDIADYYNSTQPGYQGKRITTFYYLQPGHYTLTKLR